MYGQAVVSIGKTAILKAALLNVPPEVHTDTDIIISSFPAKPFSTRPIVNVPKERCFLEEDQATTNYVCLCLYFEFPLAPPPTLPKVMSSLCVYCLRVNKRKLYLEIYVIVEQIPLILICKVVRI